MYFALDVVLKIERTRNTSL